MREDLAVLVEPVAAAIAECTAPLRVQSEQLEAKCRALETQVAEIAADRKSERENLELLIRSLLDRLADHDRQFSSLPAPKDGKDGIDGAPGKDGINGRDGIDGKDGINGKDGRDGLDGTNGRDGVDGLPGKDGSNGIDGKDGQPGERGGTGERGLDGKDGRDGRDGKDGRDGERGRDALEIDIINIDESRSYPRGTFAAYRGGTIRAIRNTDPITGDLQAAGWQVLMDGIDHTEERQVSEREVVRETRLTSGRTSSVSYVTADLIYRGVFKEGTNYQRGDVVTWGGSAWHCETETSAKPADGANWKLMVKEGRRGQDGKPGDKGERGDPGKDGRDMYAGGLR